jgi:hypothetical protein
LFLLLFVALSLVQYARGCQLLVKLFAKTCCDSGYRQDYFSPSYYHFERKNKTQNMIFAFITLFLDRRLLL